MKTILFAALISILASFASYGQDCNLLMKEKGLTHLNVKTWWGPMFSDPKFIKLKDDKKLEAVAAFNAGVHAQTVTPTNNYEMVLNVKKAQMQDGGVEYQAGYNAAGTDYFSYSVCRNDTLFFARNRGPVLVGTPENPIGYSIQGVQIIPMKLKVGDVLPTFEDISFTFPESADITVKKKVFSHMETSSSTEFGFATDTRTGERGFGEYTKTTTEAVYKDIDVTVRRTLSVTTHSIQGVNGTVTAEEDVIVNGETYKAYIIDSESWTKSNLNTTFESPDEEVNRQQALITAKVDKKMAGIMTRKQFTNKAGYMVMYSRIWFVPSVGQVKTESYDSFGGISTTTFVTGIE